MSEPKQNQIKPPYLRAFVAVVDHGNFGEAALDLGVSQAAISYAIAALEEELGVILLARGRTGVALTPVGEALIVSSRQVLQSLSSIVDIAASYRSLQRGQVRVGVFANVGTYILPTAIARFQARFPQIAISIKEYTDSEAVKQALRNYQIDIGFTDMEHSEEFQVREILREKYLALLPPGVNRAEKPLSWEELLTYPFISEVPGNIGSTRLNQHLRQCGITLNPAYEIREDATRISMVAQGLGATIVPQVFPEPIPSDIQVCQLPIPLERSICATTLTAIPQSPAVAVLLDIFFETARS